MKKKILFLSVLLSFLLVAGNATMVFATAFSIDVAWDVGTDYDSDGNSMTEDLWKFEANIGSWIKQSTTSPGSFTEYGVFSIDTIYAADGNTDDVEDYAGNTSGTSFSITGVVDDISGNVTSYTHIGTQYFLTYSLTSSNDADGDLHLYLQNGYIAGDAAQDMNDYYDNGGTYGVIAAEISQYDDGTSFADLRIGANSGLIVFDNDIFTAADPTTVDITAGYFNADFTILSGNTDWYWQGATFAAWEALGYAFGATLTSTLAPNTGYSIIKGVDANQNIDILADLQDATTFNAVPEPATMLLLGSGLLGLAGIGRKKFFKKD